MPKVILSLIRRVLISKAAVLTLMIIFVSSSAGAGQIYRWVNDNGTVGFTDDPEKVPAKYRERIKLEKEISEAGKDVNLPTTQKPPSNEKEPPASPKLSPEERNKIEEETRATWERMRKALSGK